MSTISIPEPVRAGLRARSRVDAVTLLSWYVFLIMIVPAWLVFSPAGGAGQPSTIFALILFALYLVTWLHPATSPAGAKLPVRLGIIVFGCAVIAAYVSANRTTMSSTVTDAADHGIISLADWGGVLLLAADGIDSLDRLRSLLRRVVHCAAAMAALAITQFFTGLNAVSYLTIPGLVTLLDSTDVAVRDQLNRVAATTLGPIELAAVLAMVLPFAINQARYAPPGRRLWPWSQVALIGAALPVTISKTAVVAVVAVALVMLPTWPRRDRRMACAVAGAGAVFMWVTLPRLTYVFRSLIFEAANSSSTASRTDAFSSAVPLIVQHPWLGQGFDTFSPQAYFYTDDQYVLTLIEIGIIGLLALVILLASGWVSARRARRAFADPETRDLAQCLAAAIAVSIVSFATFDALAFPVAAGLTFLMIGCSGAMLRLARG